MEYISQARQLLSTVIILIIGSGVCGLALPVSVHAGTDFWFLGELPKPFDQSTGEMHFKFAYTQVLTKTTFWSNDSSSKSGSEPKLALPLRTASGRFLAKLPIKSNAKAAENDEFWLRIWFSATANGPFIPLASDNHLIVARVRSSKGAPMPLEVITNGSVLSRANKEGDDIVIAVGQPLRLAVAWKTTGTGDYEASATTSISADFKDGLLLGSAWNVDRGEATHTGYRIPTAAFDKSATIEMQNRVFSGILDNKNKTQIGMKPVTAEQYGLMREWQNSTGRKLMAALRDSDGTVVVLKGADGNLMLVDLNSLSAADQQHVKSMRGQ
ncbi:MAG TPA: hypothetical protein PLB55_09145 [Prosthecobacter sp.]|jgi:hypothetical protein|nr:hypothetical protein [Prosthecobacter sp.]